MTYAELETFYLDLVSRARENGITCAITSEMACVYYGVAQTTKDCDLLCDPEKADIFLDLIEIQLRWPEKEKLSSEENNLVKLGLAGHYPLKNRIFRPEPPTLLRL